MPIVVTSSSQAGSISPALSTRSARRAPFSRATSTSRTEFDELREPTTITRSECPAICLTAPWRFWVA